MIVKIDTIATPFFEKNNIFSDLLQKCNKFVRIYEPILGFY